MERIQLECDVIPAPASELNETHYLCPLPPLSCHVWSSSALLQLGGLNTYTWVSGWGILGAVVCAPAANPVCECSIPLVPDPLWCHNIDALWSLKHQLAAICI